MFARLARSISLSLALLDPLSHSVSLALSRPFLLPNYVLRGIWRLDFQICQPLAYTPVAAPSTPLEMSDILFCSVTMEQKGYKNSISVLSSPRGNACCSCCC